MRKHNKTFHIRFTESEYEKLCSLSERTGLPKSTYIRFMIKGQVPRDRPSPDYYFMTKQLYRIGTLLNQIAARAHATSYIDVKRLEETIIMLRQALLDIQEAVLLPEAMDTVDEEGAKVVQRIFDLCIAGLGPTHIAKRLTRDGILNPTAHRQKLGQKVAVF